MAATIKPDDVAAVPVKRRRYSLWIAAFAAAIVVAGVGLWIGFSGGSEKPTLTFTGEALTYSGPVAFDEKLITFKLENTSDHFVVFAWGLINDDSITLQDDVSWAETKFSDPPWLAYWLKIDTVGPGVTTEATSLVAEGRIDLVAWNPESPRTYVAAIVSVTGN